MLGRFAFKSIVTEFSLFSLLCGVAICMHSLSGVLILVQSFY